MLSKIHCSVETKQIHSVILLPFKNRYAYVFVPLHMGVYMCVCVCVYVCTYEAFQVALVDSLPLVNAGNMRDSSSIPGLRKPPGRRNGDPPSPVLLPGGSHGQRSLVGYSSQGHSESDPTE